MAEALAFNTAKLLRVVKSFIIKSHSCRLVVCNGTRMTEREDEEKYAFTLFKNFIYEIDGLSRNGLKMQFIS